MSQNTYRAGDIYYVDFTPTDGNLVGGIRPSYIIKDFEEDGIVIVAPLLMAMDYDPPAWHVNLTQGKCGVKSDPIILLEMTQSVSKHRVGEYIGSAPEDICASVNAGLRAIFT